MGRKAGCRKETNISDVAKKANVSISTVSRVINNGDLVNPVTKQAIMTAMAELGYKPRSTSKFHVPTMKKNIGIIVVDVRNPFFGELIESVEKAIMTKGYLMTLCTFNNDNDTLELYLREMVERKIDGCMI